MAFGFLLGCIAYLIVRFGITGFYTVDQNERAVKTSFGKAVRFGQATTLEDPISSSLREDEKTRYTYPKVEVIPPGGPYFKWPWQRVYKVSVATQTVNMAYDPDSPDANRRGTVLEAVTKDQLNTGIVGQIRYRVSEKNLYAYLFGVMNPISHVMGYLVSILRERIANFEAPKATGATEEVSALADVAGVSINDLRKNLRSLNEHMNEECRSSEARYGVILDASLITGIDPPTEVESALAAINTAHNQVSSDISLAQAKADQTIVQSRRAVEIQTLNAEAEVEPLRQLAGQLAELKKSGKGALENYLRNTRLALYKKSDKVILEINS